MEFAYTVSTRDGKVERGTIEAVSPAEAIALLRRRDRIVVNVRPVERRAFSLARFRTRFGRVRMIDRVLLAKHLALMLRAGLTINRSLSILAEQTRNPTLRGVLREVLKAVERGEAFADVLARSQRVFSPLFVTIVRWGEAGGTLPESLERIAVQFQKDYELRSKVRTAMIYPAIVIGMTVVVGSIISVFVLPRMIKIFESFDLALPISTRIFLFVAKLLTTYGAIAVPVIIVLIVLAFFLVRSAPLRPFMHRLYLRLPIVGRIVRELNLARVDRILGSLMRSGIPIVDALAITADAAGNLQYRSALRAVRERAQKGVSIGTIFTERKKLFPPIQAQMVVVGEETGKLDEVLLYLADYYDGEVDAATKGLVTTLEPFLLVVVGLVVGGVALSIITPIYQLAGSFTR